MLAFDAVLAVEVVRAAIRGGTGVTGGERSDGRVVDRAMPVGVMIAFGRPERVGVLGGAKTLEALGVA